MRFNGGITILFLWLDVFLSKPFSRISSLTTSRLPLAPPTPVLTVTATSSVGGSNDTTAIPVALIGLISAIVVALIGAGVTLYQTRRSSQRTTEGVTGISKRSRSSLRESRKYLQMYRSGLREDPRIARLQILDMNRPLKVTDIYIQVRLHQDTKPGYEIPLYEDAMDIAPQSQLPRGMQSGGRIAGHDPNELLKRNLLWLESRASAAVDPDEAIRRYKRCVIVGDPGAGKTTLLKYLTLKAIDQQLTDLPDLPIHIELNAFATSQYPGLLEFAAARWEERYGIPHANALDLMKTRLQEGKAILLCDALDETITGTTKEAAEAEYKYVADALTELATRYHRSPLVVTARKAGYHQRARLMGFTELEVLDFRSEDIEQFVTRWFACHPDPRKQGNAAELNAKLERNPRMRALAANPLLLSLIVIVYEDQLDLPDRRAELYKRCVDTLLTKWDASRDIRRRREFKPEHKQQLLEEIAWHFHAQRQRYFPESELLVVSPLRF